MNTRRRSHQVCAHATTHNEGLHSLHSSARQNRGAKLDSQVVTVLHAGYRLHQGVSSRKPSPESFLFSCYHASSLLFTSIHPGIEETYRMIDATEHTLKIGYQQVFRMLIVPVLETDEVFLVE